MKGQKHFPSFAVYLVNFQYFFSLDLKLAFFFGNGILSGRQGKGNLVTREVFKHQFQIIFRVIFHLTYFQLVKLPLVFQKLQFLPLTLLQKSIYLGRRFLQRKTAIYQTKPGYLRVIIFIDVDDLDGLYKLDVLFLSSIGKFYCNACFPYLLTISNQ